MAFEARGDSESAIAHYRRSLEIARRIGDRGLEAKGYRAVGELFVEEGEVDRGLSLMERAVQTLRRLNDHDADRYQAKLEETQKALHRPTRTDGLSKEPDEPSG